MEEVHTTWSGSGAYLTGRTQEMQALGYSAPVSAAVRHYGEAKKDTHVYSDPSSTHHQVNLPPITDAISH